MHSLSIYYIDDRTSSCLLFQRKLDQLREDLSSKLVVYLKNKGEVEETHGCAESSARIPAFGDRESVCAARASVAPNNVGEGDVGFGINPGVQEAESWLSVCKTSIVDQGDDTGQQRGGGAGTGDRAQGVVPQECIVKTLGRYVRVSTAL